MSLFCCDVLLEPKFTKFASDLILKITGSSSCLARSLEFDQEQLRRAVQTGSLWILFPGSVVRSGVSVSSAEVNGKVSVGLLWNAPGIPPIWLF